MVQLDDNILRIIRAESIPSTIDWKLLDSERCLLRFALLCDPLPDVIDPAWLTEA